MSASRKEGENKSPFQEGMGEEKLKTMRNGNYLQKFCCKGEEEKREEQQLVEKGKLMILRKINEIEKKE